MTEFEKEVLVRLDLLVELSERMISMACMSPVLPKHNAPLLVETMAAGFEEVKTVQKERREFDSERRGWCVEDYLP